MNLSSVIALLAAFSCLEVSVVFAAIYARISQRRTDAFFSGLSLCLAGLLLRVWSMVGR